MTAHARDGRLVQLGRLVAGQTLHRDVSLDQWKISLPMIEGRRAPIPLHVATLAHRSQDILMRVIGLMARDAFHRGALVSLPGMALQARDGCVLAQQRVLRCGVVEAKALPVRRDVAAIALRSQASLVRIVLLMAAGADLRRLGELGSRVARKTFHLAVFPFERIIGLVVAEGRGLPLSRRVTSLALGSQNRPVWVVFLMACDTGGGSLRHGEPLGVALVALHRLVFAGQGKVGFGVIEPDLFPRRRRMAPVTFLTQRSTMIIVLLVAREAHLRRVTVFGFEMTLLAPDLPMFPDQGILGLAMVERGLIEPHEWESPPLVLAVTDLTPLGLDFAVKSAVLDEIDLDLFVAGHTFGAKGSPQRRVAFETLFLGFGMRLRHLAGHHPFKKTDAVGPDRPEGRQGDE